MPACTTCHCMEEDHCHYRIRCGCPNDVPPDHPMRMMDDAFHREWCSKCLVYCRESPSCPAVLSTRYTEYLTVIIPAIQVLQQRLVMLYDCIENSILRITRLCDSVHAVDLWRHHP